MAKLKPIVWIGSSKADLADFPKEVEDDVGYSLFEAQQGKMPRDAKVLRGFGGASVLEIVSNFDTDTYRAVYTVEFEDAIYVLHCFQKKSKRGSETPQQDKSMIDRRLKSAREEHERWRRQQLESRKKKS
ncbi:MAG: type II toxin-antitoxin system RelE/ParE family toxin [Fimbriimonas sp.]